MEYVFPILIVLAMLATLGVLFLGVFGMGREGHEARIRSNKLMQWRVLLQATALILFAIFMLLFRH
ncbi:MAG TPA: twin transmembrane helix small protein [Candidatus Sulfotelmatobacter sp.]|nr:twin transmembrane helix small protein [Candidatus Sulfotelmatobacter sp.]